MDIGEFLQLPDEIPYKRITNFEILEVKYLFDTSQFQIKLTTKCQNLPQDKEFIIKRKLSDFRWLFERLEQESGWVVVLPNIFDVSWSIHILPTDQTRLGLKKWYEEIYLLNGVMRFLKMVKILTLKVIYKNKPGFFKSSLFLFLDKNYELYRSFQKNQENTITEAQKNQKAQKLMSKGANLCKLFWNNGKKILTSLYNNQKPNDILIKEVKRLGELGDLIKKLNEGNAEMMRNLQVLCSNFLGEQKNIKKKEVELYTIHLKLEYLGKTISEVLKQINGISTKYEDMFQKEDNQSSIREQIIDYRQFIQQEVKGFDKELEKISDQFFTQCYENTIPINIQDIQPC